jgi:hypothetical protein
VLGAVAAVAAEVQSLRRRVVVVVVVRASPFSGFPTSLLAMCPLSSVLVAPEVWERLLRRGRGHQVRLVLLPRLVIFQQQEEPQHQAFPLIFRGVREVLVAAFNQPLQLADSAGRAELLPLLQLLVAPDF